MSFEVLSTTLNTPSKHKIKTLVRRLDGTSKHVQCIFDRSQDNMSFFEPYLITQITFEPILIAYALLFKAFQIDNELVLSVFSKMNDKFYQNFFFYINGSIRLILFVCKFDHRFLLSDIFFEVLLLLSDSNLYNANKYS